MRPYSWRKLISGMKVDCSFNAAFHNLSTLNLTIMSHELWIFEVFGTWGSKKFRYHLGLFVPQSFVSISITIAVDNGCNLLVARLETVIGLSSKILLLLVYLYVFYFGLSIISTIKITGARIHTQRIQMSRHYFPISLNLNT